MEQLDFGNSLLLSHAPSHPHSSSHVCSILVTSLDEKVEIDAVKFVSNGTVLKDPNGDRFYVSADEEDEGPPRITFKVFLMPRFKARQDVEWELELALECNGPEANVDNTQWTGTYIAGSLQHDLFLRALDEAMQLHE